MTAAAEGDVVVLLIGMRINHFRVGLWHETYIVPEGGYESIYADMPAYGLAAATGSLPIGGRGRRAADRLAHRSGASGAE
ncbi:monooxygenase family protein [Streptomyces sp. NPDC097595]|uniref:monooxygenase family protein n=1 Tax=Streptomyces sp. NPDC097595 TaxID=3366090 RepID=UPI003814058A